MKSMTGVSEELEPKPSSLTPDAAKGYASKLIHDAYFALLRDAVGELPSMKAIWESLSDKQTFENVDLVLL